MTSEESEFINLLLALELNTDSWQSSYNILKCAIGDKHETITKYLRATESFVHTLPIESGRVALMLIDVWGLQSDEYMSLAPVREMDMPEDMEEFLEKAGKGYLKDEMDSKRDIDIDIPGIAGAIFTEQGIGLTILDGWHRLYRRYLDGKKTFTVRVLPYEFIYEHSMFMSMVTKGDHAIEVKFDSRTLKSNMRKRMHEFLSDEDIVKLLKFMGGGATEEDFINAWMQSHMSAFEIEVRKLAADVHDGKFDDAKNL